MKSLFNRPGIGMDWRIRLSVFALAIAGVTVSQAVAGSAASLTTHVVAADLDGVFTPKMPTDAKEIAQASKTAKVGDEVTLHGHVALTKDAFEPDAAAFVIVDEGARQTGERPSVSTPVEELPVTVEGIASDARAVVRIVDRDGKPLSEGLSGKRGLKAGAEAFVTGKVREIDSVKGLVIDATSVHVPRGGGLPPAFITDEPPQNARDVSEAREAGDLKKGDRVALRGRVGGSKEPFVDGRAVFTLVGRGLKACNERPDDKCRFPWDYCCDPRAEITANSVTVQVVDERGNPIRTDIKGRRGIRELSEIVIVGKVVVADERAVVVNATSMAVSK